MLDLVDHDVFSLESTIDQWLPTYPHASGISIRSLLEHTAGTADMIFDAFPDYLQLLLADLDRRFSPVEVVELMARRPRTARRAGRTGTRTPTTRCSA